MEQAVVYCVNVDPIVMGDMMAVSFSRNMYNRISQKSITLCQTNRRVSTESSDDCGINARASRIFELKVRRELLFIWESMLTQSLLTEQMMDSSTIVQHERAKAMLDFYMHIISRK